MNEVAIRAEGLGKRYRLGGPQVHLRSFREAIMDAAVAPFRRLGRTLRGDPRRADETIWALKNVSFDIKRGEAIGIIGRNGAGKSTLLKILSRITEPSEGRVRIKGRVGSLLEVGTGFHHELTGRENIYLSGAILGMKKAEIDSRFDGIVAFAEIDRFLDTPVKHYSSGMYMRLAFAVAAHLDPDILLVDEVLAVGDARFQRKCLGKMGAVAKAGRTVLFVSHNMPAVTRLCRWTILLDQGTVSDSGPSHTVVAAYLGSGIGTSHERLWPDSTTAPGNRVVRLRAVRVVAQGGEARSAIDIRRPVGIEMVYEVLREGLLLVPNFHFYNEEGTCIFAVNDTSEWHRRPRSVGCYTSTAWVPGNFLAEGTVVVGAAISTMVPLTVHFYESEVVAFQVVDTLEGGSARGDYAGPFPGVVRPMLEWTTRVHEGVWEGTGAAVPAKGDA